MQKEQWSHVSHKDPVAYSCSPLSLVVLFSAKVRRLSACPAEQSGENRTLDKARMPDGQSQTRGPGNQESKQGRKRQRNLQHIDLAEQQCVHQGLAECNSDAQQHGCM